MTHPKQIMNFPTFPFLHRLRETTFPLDYQTFSDVGGNRKTPIFLFSFALIFCLIYQVALQPTWMLSGEMWAEMATNYFVNANSPSYYRKFFATDAGYIPIPQRVIAYLGNAFLLPASSIPYLYTWSSLALTGLLVAAFCLPAFRTVVKNDILRFATCMAVIIVADFETRTFINFTYFVVFFAAVLTALALVDRTKDVPIWAWSLPLLMVSKPAALVAIPGMIIAAIVSKPRFRYIVILTSVLCLGQVIRMFLSQKSGVMPLQASGLPLFAKLWASFGYFFGFLGGYLIGPDFFQKLYADGPLLIISAGMVIFGIASYVLYKLRAAANALIFVGVLLLFFTVALNCFALSAIWNSDLSKLAGLPVYRHIITGFFGCVLTVSGLLACLAERTTGHSKHRFFNASAVSLFVAWFIYTGWFTFGVKISREPGSPVLNNSQWQKMATTIDSSEPVFCVPIDPFTWGGGIYGRNCSLLNPEMNWDGLRFEPLEEIDGTFSFDTPPRPFVAQRSLVSLGILVKPANVQNSRITGKVVVRTSDGTIHHLFGTRELTTSGGLLHFTGFSGSQIPNVSSLKFIFDEPVEIGFIGGAQDRHPAVVWMGS